MVLNWQRMCDGVNLAVDDFVPSSDKAHGQMQPFLLDKHSVDR